ncbi:MAG: N-acetylneuraminate synthase family protein [Desulfobaccales bacterium]
MKEFSIAGRNVGPGHPCLIIGEVAQAHDGSLGTAHAFIDAISKAGADAIKFQTHIAAAESTPDEPWRVRFSPQDATRYDYWKRMEFTEGQWKGLAKHAKERGLIFLSSPFSIEAVELLTRVGAPAWKVASGEINNRPMIECMMQTGKPLLLSSGMSSLHELDVTIDYIKEKGNPVALLQCTTAYPCPPEKVGINLIPFFRERYNSPVGLSDHSGTIYPALAGATLEMDIFEVHVTLSREMFGPDVKASVTTGELKQLVEGIRFIEKMNAAPVDKDLLADEMTPLRHMFTKSIVAKVDLVLGTLLREDLLAVKKPGTGLPPDRMQELLGRRLRRSVLADQPVSEDDLEELPGN